MSQRKFYSTGQAAKLCGVAIRTVADWCDSGKLAFYRIPGSSHRRIEHDQMVKFAQEHNIPVRLEDAAEQTKTERYLRRLIYHLAVDPSRMVFSQRERVRQIVAEFDAMYPPDA